LDFTQAFSTTLRVLRVEKNLTQEQLAELAGLHINSVGLLERGLREPSLRTIFQLAHGLGIQPDDLVRAVAARNPAITNNPQW
jgi:transcriptional regulator with XRE-family HTH domain